MFEWIYLLWLRYQLFLLGKADAVFPFEIVSLSRKIADLKSRESAYRLIRQFHGHQSFYVRRATVITIRFIGREAFTECLDLLLSSTKDSEAWVRYDAFWALGEAGIEDERIRNVLLRHSVECVEWPLERLDEVEPTEAEQHAKIRAAKSLRLYEQFTGQAAHGE
jgi:HEAT repeat protein